MPLTEPFEFDIPLWRSDKLVALLPTLERGIWAECLFAMRLEQPFTGILSGTHEELARLARCSDVEMAQTIHALKKYKTADVYERNGIVTLINRKMNREHKARQSGRLRVTRHRERPSCNGLVTEEKIHSENNPMTMSYEDSQTSKRDGLTSKLSEERGSGGKPSKVGRITPGVPSPVSKWTPFRPGTPRELELLRQCEEVLGPQWPANSTFWGNRIYGSDRVTAEPAKVGRVMNDTAAAIRENAIKTTPAQYAMHRWKEFQ